MEVLSKIKIKWIRSLRLKKNREIERKFILDGEKMVLELIDNQPDLIELIISSDESLNFKIKTYFADDRSMLQLSSLNTPNKLLAVVRYPELKTENANFILALDGIQDPGNLGTIIRTADWFGVELIVCSNDTVDVYNPKVVQATMGSLFHVPVMYTDLEDFITEKNIPVYGTLLEGENIYNAKKNTPAIIVMGNEGKGIRDNIKSLINHSLHIPGFGEAESLNVSIATGIVLSEFRRGN